MNNFERFSSICDYGKQTMVSVQSIIENCKSIKQKITRFVSKEPQRNLRAVEQQDLLSVALTDIVTDRTFVTWLSSTTYQDALEDEDGVTEIIYDNLGNTIQVANSSIVDAVESLTQECTLQEEFLTYVMSAETIVKSDFISTISNKFHSISGVMIDKYAQLLTSDTFSALSNFIGLISSNTVDASSDQYIEVVDTSIYYDGPNVWLTAVTEIFDTVASFFSEAFERFTGIKDFFIKLWNGIKELGKYLVKKLFSQLVTIYEKGDTKYGVMDVPVIQFPIGKLQRSISDGIITYSVINYGLSDDNANNSVHGIRKLLYNDQTGPSPRGATAGFGFWASKSYRGADTTINGLDPTGEIPVSGKFYQHTDEGQPAFDAFVCAQQCCYNLINSDDDGSQYLLPYDVVIPSSAISEIYDFIQPLTSTGTFDVVLRISATSDLIVTVGVYIATSYSDIESIDDKAVAKKVVASIFASHLLLASMLPTTPFSLSDNTDWATNNENAAARLFMSAFFNNATLFCFTGQNQWDNEPDENFNLISRCGIITANFNAIADGYINDGVQGEATYSLGLFLSNLIIAGALLGPIHNTGKILHTGRFPGPLHVELCISFSDFITSRLFKANDCEATWTGAWLALDNVQQDITVSEISAIYRPYVKYALLGNSVHVQSYAERVREVKVLIISAVIAIAATVITYKVLKYRRRRLDLQAIRQAQLDTYLFNMTDPQSEVSCSIEGYTKLRKKLKRTNRLNSLLGFNSDESIITNSDGVSGVVASLKALANGSTDNKNTFSLADLRYLIKSS